MFEQIRGNEHIKEFFEHALKQQKIPHACILSGEDGLGKRLFAEAFAKALQCEGEGARPCGKCRSCLQMDGHNQPDVIFVGHEKPGSIGVDDIREGLNQDILIRPYQSPYKVYIVDEAEKMTVQAQNVLLKTLEEPPEYGVILLLTENAESFLPTILSRSVVLNLKPVTDEELREALRGLNLEKEKLETISRFAGGNIGKARKMAESEDFSEMMDLILHLLKDIRRMKLDQLLHTIRSLEKYKLQIKDCIDFMERWYRDVLLFKATNDMNTLIFKEEFRYIRQEAQVCSFPGIEQILQAMETAKRRLDANVNFELAMELMLLTIQEN